MLRLAYKSLSVQNDFKNVDVIVIPSGSHRIPSLTVWLWISFFLIQHFPFVFTLKNISDLRISYASITRLLTITHSLRYLYRWHITLHREIQGFTSMPSSYNYTNTTICWWYFNDFLLQRNLNALKSILDRQRLVDKYG